MQVVLVLVFSYVLKVLLLHMCRIFVVLLPARHYAVAVLAVIVCPSVCLSVNVLLRRLNLGSRK